MDNCPPESIRDTSQNENVDEKILIQYIHNTVRNKDIVFEIETICEKFCKSKRTLQPVEQVIARAKQLLQNGLDSWFLEKEEKLKVLYKLKYPVTDIVKEKCLENVAYELNEQNVLTYVKLANLRLGKREHNLPIKLTERRKSLMEFIKEYTFQKVTPVEDDIFLKDFQEKFDLKNVQNRELKKDFEIVKYWIEADDQIDVFTKMHILYITQAFINPAFVKKIQIQTIFDEKDRIITYCSDVFLNYNRSLSRIEENTQKGTMELDDVIDPDNPASLNESQLKLLKFLLDLCKISIQVWPPNELLKEYQKRNDVTMDMNSFIEELETIYKQIQFSNLLGVYTQLALFFITQTKINKDLRDRAEKFGVVVDGDNQIVSFRTNGKMYFHRTNGISDSKAGSRAAELRYKAGEAEKEYEEKYNAQWRDYKQSLLKSIRTQLTKVDKSDTSSTFSDTIEWMEEFVRRDTSEGTRRSETVVISDSDFSGPSCSDRDVSSQQGAEISKTSSDINFTTQIINSCLTSSRNTSNEPELNTENLNKHVVFHGSTQAKPMTLKRLAERDTVVADGLKSTKTLVEKSSETSKPDDVSMEKSDDALLQNSDSTNAKKVLKDFLYYTHMLFIPELSNLARKLKDTVLPSLEKMKPITVIQQAFSLSFDMVQKNSAIQEQKTGTVFSKELVLIFSKVSCKLKDHFEKYPELGALHKKMRDAQAIMKASGERITIDDAKLIIEFFVEQIASKESEAATSKPNSA